MLRLSTMIRALLVLICTYLFSLGATWNGVLIPDLRMISLWLLILLCGGWLLHRTLRGKGWHNTPLDPVIAFWFGVIALSLVANEDAWRRIVIGMWFVGLYVLVWYLLLDLLARRIIDRDMLVDGLLFAGLIVIGFGYFQLRALEFDLRNLELPRPGSIIGNPNSLGAFLVVLTPLSLARFALVKNRLARGILLVYAAATLFLLFLTFSRGAWIGAGGSIVVLGFLLLADADLLNMANLRAWWRDLPRFWRVMARVTGLIVLVTAIVVVVLVTGTLGGGDGRSPGLRFALWGHALDMFAEKPFTGHGLFTYGRELHQYQSMPPAQPHSHAHNIILNIAAELGLPGLIVMVGTLALVVRPMRQNLRVVTGKNRAAVFGSMAAVVGFGVHHLLDTTAMMPAIALAGLVVLAIAAAPLDLQPVRAIWRRIGHPVALILLALILFPVGLYATSLYSDYIRALDYVNVQEYRAAAVAMDAVVADDPHNAINYQQQGYLWGLVAYLEDSDEAFIHAIDAYTRFTEIEPDNAVGWANLGGLYASTGETMPLAYEMLERAVELAPEDGALWFILGAFAERNNDLSRAWYAYEQAMTPEQWMILTDAQRTVVERTIQPEGPSIIVAAIHGLFEYGRPEGQLLSVDQVEQAWVDSGLEYETDSTQASILRLFLILESEITLDPNINMDATATELLDDATASIETDEDRAWLHIGRARLARFKGDRQTAEAEISALPDLLLTWNIESLDTDYVFGTNIGYAQFLRYVIPRQFLLPVGYTHEDMLFGYLSTIENQMLAEVW